MHFYFYYSEHFNDVEYLAAIYDKRLEQRNNEKSIAHISLVWIYTKSNGNGKEENPDAYNRTQLNVSYAYLQ